jgi:dihydrofolate synthase/folylpolyglutamate synthase
MTYQETIDWMFSQLPMYQRQGKSAFKKDLTNISAFCGELKNPQKKFASIHVGGTNGKGSTSHIISSILQEAGYKVGLYTSPHLKNFTERIRINGEEVSRNFVVDFVATNKHFLENQQLSFFEMTVGMAFAYFAEQNVDIAIIEVGLGGRLDSTNVINPEVSVITNIGYDHVQFLGDTLPEIAFEKAGIIKQNTPIIIGEKQDAVVDIFINKATQMNADIYFASDKKYDYKSDLLGSYQEKNISTAIHAVKVLKGYVISESHFTKGLKNVVKNTNFKGRWQILQHKPLTICDTAHNREGLSYIMNQITSLSFNKLHIVLGVVNDKKLDDILVLFPANATYYFCKPNIPRGLNEIDLQSTAENFYLVGDAYGSVHEAYFKAISDAEIDDVVFVGGSTFVVAEVV